ncbi:UNVERIFIED_CONTAM: helix-turn-helix domain-containing protein [Bacillus amyloliquefaciens DSM 7 = ATCC 23350]|nr:helix-turn-helix domain-containing protein [Bacillus amyloliquefaciens]QDP93263.1 helix-turn-helix domain-containing protein [Bacillus amyloliquefaciens]TXK31894.1 helix-turn-helix domain-containing protein [Bacillus amyloliquefaciens]
MLKLRPSYKPMEITLIKRDKIKADLKKDLGISSSTLAKMSRGDVVALTVILKICEYLECPIQDIVEFVEDDSEES